MTKRSLLFVALASLLSLSLPSFEARAQIEGGSQIGPCRALTVTDADSADLFCAGEVWRVRLRNLAAPRPGQAGHSEATRALAELLRARDLFIVPDRTGELPLDPSERVQVYLLDRSGANLNVVMVLLGWASYSPEPAPSRIEKSFRLAEHEARAERRALWTVWSVSADR